MTTMTPRTGRALRPAAHPLSNRERRTSLNYTFREAGIPVKVCSRCYVVKHLSAFNRYSSSSDGLNSYCRACHASTHATRQASDAAYRQARRAYSLAYIATHVEARRAYAKRRQERVAAQNKAKHIHRVQDPNVLKRCAGECGQTLPETDFRLDRRTNDGLRAHCRCCADSSRRSRAACLAAYGPAIGLGCYLCGESITAGDEVQVDHLVPRSGGGPDTADNVRWVHAACNRARFTKPLTREQLARAQAFGPLPASLPSPLGELA